MPRPEAVATVWKLWPMSPETCFGACAVSVVLFSCCETLRSFLFSYFFSVFWLVVVALTPYQCEHSPVIVPAKMSDDGDIGVCSQNGQDNGHARHCPGDAHQHWRSHAIRMFK